MKELTVITGPRYNPSITIIQLPGVQPDARLTPKLARMAARAAQGTSAGATVWDEGAGIGYALYPNTARKLHKAA